MRDTKVENNRTILLHEFYDPLPCGIVEINDTNQITFENKVFIGLMKIAAKEFGDRKAARELFAQACLINANKRAWVMRIFDQDTGAMIPIKIRSLSKVGVPLRRFYIETVDDELVTQHSGQMLYGRFRIDRLANTVFFGREIVPLSKKEFELLVFLASNEDRVVTKRDIKRCIWENQQMNPRAMDILVARLRLKLFNAGLKKEIIRTVHGRGYMFRAEELHRTNSPSVSKKDKR